MKKFIIYFFLIAISFTSCSTSKTATSSSSEDGLSFETAVVIKEKTETKGVDAEYNWIGRHYPNYKVKGQSLTSHEKKRYDIITIIKENGAEVKLYFDISNFFGKL